MDRTAEYAEFNEEVRKLLLVEKKPQNLACCLESLANLCYLIKEHADQPARVRWYADLLEVQVSALRSNFAEQQGSCP